MTHKGLNLTDKRKPYSGFDPTFGRRGWPYGCSTPWLQNNCGGSARYRVQKWGRPV